MQQCCSKLVPPGIYPFTLDMARVQEARTRVPSLANRRDFKAP